MSDGNIVHVVGTGTIGEPLIGLLCDAKNDLGIDEITFYKHSANPLDRPKIKGLINRGANLAVSNEKINDFIFINFRYTAICIWWKRKTGAAKGSITLDIFYGCGGMA